MAITPEVNLTVEQLERALKIKRAEERMTELKNTLGTFKQEVNGANGLEEVFKVCSRFVARVSNARGVLGTSTAKKGRKPKKD